MAQLQVRLEFLMVVGDWMLTLRERSDHEGRLLPFLLAGLVDETPQVCICTACSMCLWATSQHACAS